MMERTTNSKAVGRLRPDDAGSESSLLLTVTEAARLLRISRNLAYELVAQGRLPHVRLGRVIRVPRHGLEQWIAQESRLPEQDLGMVSYRPQQH